MPVQVMVYRTYQYRDCPRCGAVSELQVETEDRQRTWVWHCQNGHTEYQDRTTVAQPAPPGSRARRRWALATT